MLKTNYVPHSYIFNIDETISGKEEEQLNKLTERVG